tara:strand:- start:1130 stop:1252 length:123 start_codon:yes stop_codon:yes gene_type:complete
MSNKDRDTQEKLIEYLIDNIKEGDNVDKLISILNKYVDNK